METLLAWELYLSQEMNFPFDAELLIGDDNQLEKGDKVVVDKIEGYDDLWGLITVIHYNKNRYWALLSDLDILDMYSDNYSLFEKYLVWHETAIINTFYNINKSDSKDKFASLIETKKFSFPNYEL